VTANKEGADPMEITTLGIDLAKAVFQLHGVDGDGGKRLADPLLPALVVP
jgi:hypothetical protein